MTFLKWTPERSWLGAGFGLLALLMGMSGVVSHQNTTQLVENSRTFETTYRVIRDLNQIFSLMTVAESGRRGYIYMNNRQELARYQDAVKAIVPEMQQLRSHLNPNLNTPVFYNVDRVRELDRLVTQRLDLLKQSIEMYRPENPEIIVQEIITRRSIALRDRIEFITKELEQDQQSQLDRSIESLQTSIQNRKIIEFWLVFSGFSILVLSFVSLHHQLLERQRAEVAQQALSQQNELSELKLKFFSMVSHEFRTPLSIILGSAQLLTLRDRLWDSDQTMKSVQRIQSSAKVMRQLLTDILTLTRAEAGKLECNPETLDLEAFCLNLIEDFESSSAFDHVLDFTSDCQLSHAYLDERLLYSILSNLISNAIKYSPEKTIVRLELSCTPEHLIFRVKDQGKGIALDDRNLLFEPFHRGQHPANIKGTGLGLSVVKTCVDLQRGTIEVESTPGKGSTFTVTFPHKSLVGI